MVHKQSMALGGVTHLSVLAPIRRDMVQGFEPISYRQRLEKVLRALHAARRNARESEQHTPYFPDTVGRHGIIHQFRYTLVPPQPGAEKQPADGQWHLSLNVSFDGGWEPYMRVIYRDLGPLLDLLFCHSPGYPGSRTARFEAYADWVRRNEVTGGTFYTDSAGPAVGPAGITADAARTVEDGRYLAQVEQAQRDGPASDAALARLALPSEAQRDQALMARAVAQPVQALVLPLRTLKGLYRLSLYFPDNGSASGGLGAEGDRGILRRFAHDLLKAPLVLMRGLDALPATLPARPLWDGVKATYRDELDWLQGGDATNPPADLPRDPLDASVLQSHPLAVGEHMTHGAAVLLRVRDRDQALQHIAHLASLCGPVPERGTGYLVAFTPAGLQALGVAAQRLQALPQEFTDGMEARCGLLGDVRGNHPDHWDRPRAYRPNGMAEGSGDTDGGSSNDALGAALPRRQVDLSTVHLMVHLRLADPANPDAGLHPRLQEAVHSLNNDNTGLRVLAVQPLRSMRNPAHQAVGHFGFVDGISQPQWPLAGQAPLAPGKHHDSRVRAGELLLGRANDRGDTDDADIEPLLENGSFLVVRKLRQHVDRLNQALAPHATRREEVLSHMMGRTPTGLPLAPVPSDATDALNDFNYQSPQASAACPFQAHARRANPRDGRPYTPRLLRRGMSYGPPAGAELDADADAEVDRGVFFMAYCASIAEQFETLQRWMAGGNSSGLSSALADPFLRVPQLGEPSAFRYVDAHGAVQRVVFDDRPLVQLAWGLYLFVPSLAVLRGLKDLAQAPVGPGAKQPDSSAPDDPQDALDELERMRQRLEDPDRSPAAWQAVRDQPEGLPFHSVFGHLVGRHPEVLRVMKDDGQAYSVHGYGERMSASLGLNLLGLDPTDAAYEAQRPLREAIEAVSAAEAYARTREQVAAVLVKLPSLPSAHPGSAVRQPIDLLNFSDQVMAGLCRHWIGLPNDTPPSEQTVMVTGGRLDNNPGVPRCPGNFATTSRYIFSPHPRAGVEQAGQAQGQAMLAAVRQWLADGGALGPLAQDIQTRLAAPAALPYPAAVQQAAAQQAQATPSPDLAAALAGVLLGFPPTVQGNFIRTLETWIDSQDLWQRQQDLADLAPDGAATYAQAEAALGAPLMQTMRQRPVPEMLWRCPVDKGQADLNPQRRVVLGIASALTDPAAPDELLFGRDSASESPTVHGCPGMAMALGVLLGLLAGLMEAGTLRPTGSPVLLILTPP